MPPASPPGADMKRFGGTIIFVALLSVALVVGVIVFNEENKTNDTRPVNRGTDPRVERVYPDQGGEGDILIPAEPSSSGASELRTDSGLDQDVGNGAVSDANTRAETGAKNDFSDPMTAPTAAEFIENLAERANWDSGTISRNVASWLNVCPTATKQASLQPSRFVSEDAISQAQSLAAYCEGIREKTELARLENLENNLDNRLSETAPTGIFDSLDSYSREDALNVVMRELKFAIEKFDEAIIRLIMLEIVDNELYPPEFRKGVPNPILFLKIETPVSVSIFCQHIGGCKGAQHPIVLRYCFGIQEDLQVYCSSPQNLQEAVYQTLTPVEYEVYLEFMNWLNAELL